MEPGIWDNPRRRLDLTTRGVIMGILNVTPDSFSDGGNFEDPERAVAHALEMEREGAEIIDVGGESTRPGAPSVSEEEELRRVIPVIAALRARSDILISIDTSKSSVALAAMKAGADIINDVTALGGDPEMMDVARDTRAGVVLMHMRGNPRTMQQSPEYDDVVGEVREFLRQRMEAAVASGVDPMRIALDPGIGFGKTSAHNFSLLKHTADFVSLRRPVLIGVSRKSFLGQWKGTREIASRLWSGVALTSFCRARGARIFRVHEPQPHFEAMRMTEAILGD